VSPAPRDSLGRAKTAQDDKTIFPAEAAGRKTPKKLEVGRVQQLSKKTRKFSINHKFSARNADNI
jgi:hypothetical protein